MTGVGRDLCGSSSPTPLLKQGHLQQAAQDLVQAGLEHLQRRRLHNLPGQPHHVVSHSLFLVKLTCYGLDKRSVRWVGNRLMGRTQRVVVNSSFSNWQLVTTGVPQESTLGPVLFNTFISDLDDEIKCTLANDTKLSGEVDTSEGRATLQEDLDRLEEQANKKLTKFIKGKCKVLDLGKQNPGVQPGWDLPSWAPALWKGTWGSWWTVSSI